MLISQFAYIVLNPTAPRTNKVIKYLHASGPCAMYLLVSNSSLRRCSPAIPTKIPSWSGIIDLDNSLLVTGGQAMASWAGLVSKNCQIFGMDVHVISNHTSILPFSSDHQTPLNTTTSSLSYLFLDVDIQYPSCPTYPHSIWTSLPTFLVNNREIDGDVGGYYFDHLLIGLGVGGTPRRTWTYLFSIQFFQ